MDRMSERVDKPLRSHQHESRLVVSSQNRVVATRMTCSHWHSLLFFLASIAIVDIAVSDLVFKTC